MSKPIKLLPNSTKTIRGLRITNPNSITMYITRIEVEQS
jgi:hypothetical protein